MQEHSQTEVHIKSCENAATVLKVGSITQLIQSVTDQQKMKNRMTIMVIL